MGQWVEINMFPKMESGWRLWGAAYSELELGPFLRPPKVSTTFTNLLTYWILLLARPVFFFFFSPASEGLHNVHEPPDVLDPPLSAPSLLFLLLASLDLRGLASDLSSTSERSVDLSSLEGDGQVDGLVLKEGKANLILQRSSRAEEVQLFGINSLKERKLGPECLHIGGGGDVEHMGLLTPNDQLHVDFSCRSESSNKSLVT